MGTRSTLGPQVRGGPLCSWSHWPRCQQGSNPEWGVMQVLSHCTSEPEISFTKEQRMPHANLREDQWRHALLCKVIRAIGGSVHRNSCWASWRV